MTRSTRAVLLMCVLLWQALAWLTPPGQAQQAQDLTNRLVHAQAVDHHHHADASLHVDDSVDSQRHHHAHEAVQPAGLLPASIGLVAVVPPVAPPVARPSAWVSVWLDSPLRPPQTCA